MNNVLLTGSYFRAPVQLWHVVENFHRGDFVKALLEARHINTASVARSMKVARTTFNGYFEQSVISDVVLRRITEVIGFDLLGMVRAEEARLEAGGKNEVGEPRAEYRRSMPGGGQGLVWQIRAEDYDEETQVEILRFLQKLPLRKHS